MANLALFSRLGIFVRENFLDAETCARLRQEARSSPFRQGVIQPELGKFEVDLGGRKVRHALISPDTTAFLTTTLNDLRPALNQHFNTTLDVCEVPETVIYGAGDFYVPHVDGDDEIPRQVSAILYLNGHSAVGDDDAFEGGELVLYNLFGDARSKNVGIPLEPQAGLLVAFSSRMLHEVKAVTSGERLAIVTCFS